MAIYYVRTAGGNANVAATYSTDASLKAGGAAAATVPTSADDITFTSASGSWTMTVNASIRNLVCEDGYAGTLAFGTSTLTLSGTSLVFSTQCTLTGSGTISTTGSLTLSMNLKTFPGAFTTGSTAGTTLTLNGAMSIGGIFTCNGGLITNGWAVSVSQWTTSSTTTRTWALGNSTITVGAITPFSIPTAATGLTIQASNAALVFSTTSTSAAYTIQPLVTWKSIAFPNTSSFSISTSVTCQTFSKDMSSAGQITLGSGATLTITTTASFTRTGTGENARILSSTTGTVATLSLPSGATFSQMSFRDIAVVGAVGTLSGTRLGDAGGNSGITFQASTTLYRVTSGAAWFGTSRWGLTRGSNTANQPLPQDDVVIPSGTSANSAGGVWLCRNLTIESGGTYSTTTSLTNIFGDLTVLSGGTATDSTSTVTLAKRGTATVSGDARGVQLNSVLGTTTVLANGCRTRGLDQVNGGVFEIPAGATVLTRNYTMGSSAIARSLTMGANSRLKLTGGTSVPNIFLSNAGTNGGHTVDPTAVVEFAPEFATTYSIQSVRAFAGTLEWSQETVPVGTVLTMSNSTNPWERLAVSGPNKDVRLSAGINFREIDVLGTEASKVAFRSTVAGTRRTVGSYLKASSSWKYATITDIGLPVGQESIAYDSVDGGNNLGFSFQASAVGGLVYWDGVGYEPWYDGTKLEAWYDGQKTV